MHSILLLEWNILNYSNCDIQLFNKSLFAYTLTHIYKDILDMSYVTEGMTKSFIRPKMIGDNQICYTNIKGPKYGQG